MTKVADSYEVVPETGSKSKKTKSELPARNPKSRENQLINLAMNLAEKKLRDGTASSQIIVTLLNLATTKAKLELAKLQSDLELSEAKAKQIQDQKTSGELYAKAIEAFKSYSGYKDLEESEDDDDY